MPKRIITTAKSVVVETVSPQQIRILNGVSRAYDTLLTDTGELKLWYRGPALNESFKGEPVAKLIERKMLKVSKEGKVSLASDLALATNLDKHYY